MNTFEASEPCYFNASGDAASVTVYRSPMLRWNRSRLLAGVRGFIAEHDLVLVSAEEHEDQTMFLAKGITEVYRPLNERI